MVGSSGWACGRTKPKAASMRREGSRCSGECRRSVARGSPGVRTEVNLKGVPHAVGHRPGIHTTAVTAQAVGVAEAVGHNAALHPGAGAAQPQPTLLTVQVRPQGVTRTIATAQRRKLKVSRAPSILQLPMDGTAIGVIQRKREDTTRRRITTSGALLIAAPPVRLSRGVIQAYGEMQELDWPQTKLSQQLESIRPSPARVVIGQRVDQIKDLLITAKRIPLLGAVHRGVTATHVELEVSRWHPQIREMLSLHAVLQKLRQGLRPDLPHAAARWPIPNAGIHQVRGVARWLAAAQESDGHRDRRFVGMGPGRRLDVVAVLELLLLEMLRSRKPDLLLLDLIMPAMSGFQVLEEKRKDPAISDIPVIVISSRDPLGEAITSNTIRISHNGGFSTGHLLDIIQAVTQIIIPAGASKQ